MSINKQSSVEWLDRWFRDNPEATHEEGNAALEQAKEMHKNEILIAYDNGWESGYYNPEEYYTEKFESKK